MGSFATSIDPWFIFPDLAQNKAQLVPFTRAAIPEGYEFYDCAASENVAQLAPQGS